MNAPKPINAMKHFGGGPEYGGKKKPGEINYIAKMAFLCLAVMTVVCLFMHHTNDSLQQNDNLPAKPLQRPIGAYIQADVTSVELEHVAEGKITTCTVEGEVLDLLRKWTNNLQPVETSTGKWTIDFETGNTPEQMEWKEAFTVTVTPSDYQNGSCGFSYFICNSEEQYLVVDGNWFLVKNPSYPPIFQ